VCWEGGVRGEWWWWINSGIEVSSSIIITHDGVTQDSAESVGRLEKGSQLSQLESSLCI